MHILLINDDGPPSPQSAPYVLPFVETLKAKTNHTISVVLPNRQRSWIGKAHLVGESLTPTFYNPSTGIISERPQCAVTCAPVSRSPGQAVSTTRKDYDDEWVLVDGTPASCAQVGLYHFFQSRGPVDLVLSGPNYGRNTTAAFALSSGTIGGAQEAAVCGFRAIAISFAFKGASGLGTPALAEACELTVRIVENLIADWSKDVDLYSINTPIVDGVSRNKVLWTKMLGNKWSGGSCFREVMDEDIPEDDKPGLHEKEIRSSEIVGPNFDPPISTGKRKFLWAPKFGDVYNSVEKAGPGSDGWAVKENCTSITPMRANFMPAAPTEGEFKL